jgi:peptide/nickel transport system substrate-binding protein
VVLVALLALAVVPTDLGRDGVETSTTSGASAIASDTAGIASGETSPDETAPSTTGAATTTTGTEPAPASTTTSVPPSRHFDTITVAVPTDVTTFDPDAAASGRDLDMLANLYSGLTRRVLEPSAVATGLYRWSPTEVAPDLAESINVSEDGTVYTFRIRPDLEFPGGHAVAARDFAYAWERALALAASGAPPGATAAGLAAAGIHSMSQVEVVDDHILRVTLPRPNPRILRVMAMGVMSAVDSILLRSQATEADPWATGYAQHNPSGYGPYILVDREAGQQMTLEPYEGWWDHRTAGRSRISYRVVADEARRLQLVQEGTVDLAHGMSAAGAGEAGSSVRVISLESAGQRFLVFDRTEPPFDDPRVRQAVAWAMDYNRIKQEVYEGRARVPTGFLPAGLEGSDGTWPYSQDIGQARTLLAEAGHADGSTVELLVPSDLPEAEALAERIRSDLELAGIDLVPWPIEGWHLHVAIRLGGATFDLAIVACGSWLQEAWYASRQLAEITPACPASFMHPEVEQLLDQMEPAPTAEAAAALAGRIQDIWAREAAFVPLARPDQIAILGQEVSGFVLTNEDDALYFPLLQRVSATTQ